MSSPSRLYIPLRSDETLIAVDDEVALLFFISHYVQMKHDPVLREVALLFLYIPLRSDETLSVFIRSRRRSSFISHYVQMKLDLKRPAFPVLQPLYPTTFR